MTDNVVALKRKSLSKWTREQLVEEVERLRELMDVRPAFQEEDWAIVVNVDDNFRDRMAARAFIAAQGNPYAALRILGYATDLDPETKRTSQGYSSERLKSIAKKLFERESVKEIIGQTGRKAEDFKDAIVERLIEQAVFGEPANSIRAATLLAKMNVGWLAPTKMQVQSQTISLTSLLANPEKFKEIAQMLGHEPGSAVRIHSEAADKLAIATIEDE